MSLRRMLPFLLLNVIVSATVVLAILWWWDGRDQAAEPAALPAVVATLPANVEAAAGGEDAVGDTAVDNPAPDAPPDSASDTASGDNPIHVVAAGDTLGRLSEQYDVTIDEIMTANELANPNLLSVGQQLIIPVYGMPEAAPEATAESPSDTADTPPTPIPTVAAVGGDAEITIVQVTGAGDLASEAVQLVNNGSSDANLQGWQLLDAHGNVYTFGGVTLFGTGAGIVIHTGSGQDTPTDLYWGIQAAIWEPGEEVTLVDAAGTPRATFVVGSE
nr:putative peptidoglycan-binding protein [uncultured bacterium]